MAVNFSSSKDSEETCTVYNPSDNIEILISNETDEIIEKLLDSLFFKMISRKSRKKNERKWIFFYESVDLLHYKLHTISLNRGGSYIDSPKWLK